MREILFRGICRETQEFDDGTGVLAGTFVHGQFVTDGKDAWIVGNIADVSEEYIAPEFWIPVIPETVGQCAGLEDVNKAKIFEGDIVCVFSQAYDTKRNANTVDYKDGSFRYVSPNPYMGDAPCGCYRSRQVEIIGNIHENPELLEVSP